MTTANQSTEDQTGSGTGPPATVTSRTDVNRVWIANHKARFKMTPTIAAVIAWRPADKRSCPRSRSANGAPRKIHRKQGANVAHVATTAPITPATNGSSVPGCWYAPTKPTNSVTMIRGPGVLSARPSPVTIWFAESHPYLVTAAWVIYASTAYAPPNVTIEAFEKNHACCEIVDPCPAQAATSSSGTNHTASPTARTRIERLSFTVVCSPAEPSSEIAAGSASCSAGTVKVAGHRAEASSPISPAVITMTGKGTCRKKIETKAIAAMRDMARLRKAFFPMRMVAAATMPTTAAPSPSKMPFTHGTSPYTTKT